MLFPPWFRVESFIEHQDSCSMSRVRADSQGLHPPCLSRTASSPSRSSETHLSTAPRPETLLNCHPPQPASNKDGLLPSHEDHIIVGTPLSAINYGSNSQPRHPLNLDLQLAIGSPGGARTGMTHAVSLENDTNNNGDHNNMRQGQAVSPPDILSVAISEKEYANRMRIESSRELAEAEREFASAKRMRQQAQAELEKAMLMKEITMKQVDSGMLTMTCQSCKQCFFQPEHQHHHGDLLAAINGTSGVSAMRGDQSSQEKKART
ncbi:hypothetical protein SAY86_006200 [Trapa natans]|uniref:Uncharacterized protein n=1 Tax=Trapa natans TaxID=22666 RepID=A0AAN7LDH9_TRANT|nr:hypothetical protein SAY86_006200 [Trapa natans]